MARQRTLNPCTGGSNPSSPAWFVDGCGDRFWDDTTATFTTKAPYLTIKVPNGNEVWNRGLDYFIEWSGNIEEDVILELYKENEYVSLIDTVVNTDAYLWSIPPSLDSACNYHVSIRSVENDAIQDVSDITFAINDSSCSVNTVPYVEVISPNGGEVLNRMNDVEISWENTTGETVKVELMKGYEEILAVLYEMLKPSVKAGRKLEEDTDLVADLGLDSLKVMTLVEEVEDYFDMSIPLNILANVRTIKDFATQLQQLTEEGQ